MVVFPTSTNRPNVGRPRAPLAGLLALLVSISGCDRAAMPVNQTALICDTCRIQLTTMLHLGTDRDSVGISILSSPAKGPHGSLLVAPMSDRYSIGVFDADGQLARLVGRNGDGPGEFRSIREVAVDPDANVLVIAERFTLLSPTFDYHRSEAIPVGLAPMRAVALPDGRFAINSSGREHAALHYLNSDLELDRSFGPRLTEGEAHPGVMDHLLTPDASGGIWTARMRERYVLTHYDSLGALLRTIEPASAWFDPWSLESGRRPAVAPDPRYVRPEAHVTGLWREAGGNLWVSIMVADRDWRPAEPQTLSSGEGQGHGAMMPSEWPRLFDSYIEVIDPNGSSVLSTRRYDGLLAFTGDGLLWELQELASGALSIHILRPSLSVAAQQLNSTED